MIVLLCIVGCQGIGVVLDIQGMRGVLIVLKNIGKDKMLLFVEYGHVR